MVLLPADAFCYDATMGAAQLSAHRSNFRYEYATEPNKNVQGHLWGERAAQAMKLEFSVPYFVLSDRISQLLKYIDAANTTLF